jgi:hypothetical protein
MKETKKAKRKTTVKRKTMTKKPSALARVMVEGIDALSWAC